MTFFIQQLFSTRPRFLHKCNPHHLPQLLIFSKTCLNSQNKFVLNERYVLIQGHSTAPVIKLVGGMTSNEGNVMVDGKPVCDDYWDTKDAKVVCKMLGYTGGDAIIESAYGPTGVDFAMDDVQCNGNEHTILDCPHITNSNCATGEAAGVQCVSSGLLGKLSKKSDFSHHYLGTF